MRECGILFLLYLTTPKRKKLPLGSRIYFFFFVLKLRLVLVPRNISLLFLFSFFLRSISDYLRILLAYQFFFYFVVRVFWL